MGVVNTVTCSLSFTYLFILNSNNLPLKCSYLFKIHVCKFSGHERGTKDWSR